MWWMVLGQKRKRECVPFSASRRVSPQFPPSLFDSPSFFAVFSLPPPPDPLSWIFFLPNLFALSREFLLESISYVHEMGNLEKFCVSSWSLWSSVHRSRSPPLMHSLKSLPPEVFPLHTLNPTAKLHFPFTYMTSESVFTPVVVSKYVDSKISMSVRWISTHHPSTHQRVQNFNKWSYAAKNFWKSITRDTMKTIAKTFCNIWSGYEVGCLHPHPHSFSTLDVTDSSHCHITNWLIPSNSCIIPPSLLYINHFEPIFAAIWRVDQKFHVLKCCRMVHGKFSDRRTISLKKVIFSRDKWHDCN